MSPKRVSSNQVSERNSGSSKNANDTLNKVVAKISTQNTMDYLAGPKNRGSNRNVPSPAAENMD